MLEVKDVVLFLLMSDGRGSAFSLWCVIPYLCQQDHPSECAAQLRGTTEQVNVRPTQETMTPYSCLEMSILSSEDDKSRPSTSPADGPRFP